MKRVGVLFGMEDTFPGALVSRINEMNAGVAAEFVTLGATRMDAAAGYDVIVDRISHDIPYYRSFLKNAVLGGTRVINNPFWWSADDKFFNYALAARLGVAIPRTVLLPSNQHPPNTTSRSMRNLHYPLDWKAVFDYVGWPAFLKPHAGGGWRHVYKCHDEKDFFHYYHLTGDLVMTLQEAVDFKEYVRCYCIGQEKVLVMHYDPRQPHENRYVKSPAPLEPALEERIVKDTLTICRVLGYDMNTVEFAVRDGIPYAIDFMNPAPDADYYSVGAENFAWVVNAMAELAVKRALEPPGAATEYRWASLLNGAVEAPAKGKGTVKAAGKAVRTVRSANTAKK